jgi:wobble nucleotide-excising tRNase
MSTQSLDDIAGQLKNNASKVQLIYAFNGTGKTRLSRAFKELFQIQEDDFKTRHKIIYYNAFTEDLFYWDNDSCKLKIQPNSFTDWILKDQGQDQNIVTNFQRYIRNKLTPRFNEACTEVVFSLKRGNDEHFDHLKISKGEESSFIWNIFYTLLSQIISVLNQKPEDRETPDYNDLEYIFIDDPVSSLDDNHLIQMACDLAVLINGSSSPLKFVIATHNTVFYNVLFEELNIKNKKKDGISFILRQVDEVIPPKTEVFKSRTQHKPCTSVRGA